MMLSRDNADTIAAVATPAGEGGIAVLRVSGPQAIAITDIKFSGARRLTESATHTLHFGRFESGGRTIDTVVASVYRAPHSYTGEDTVELSCHGGYYVSQTILAALLAQGARLAEPGEFTLRAFLNGKLDLAQAEAVADVIHAKSEKSHRASVQQLQGSLSRYIGSLRTELLDLCALFELELDFADEDITLADRSDAARALDAIRSRITQAVASFRGGRVVREGVKAVLAGKPNAGKSSLLNILLDENRAIVSPVPGTTRDSIEESITLEGLLFTFIDTAGLRETADEIEQEGVRRTHSHISSADVLVLIVDASTLPSEEDLALYRSIERTVSSHTVLIYVFNKSDCEAPGFREAFAHVHTANSCTVSCKTHEGIEGFKELLYRTALPAYDSDAASVTITNLRHKQSLERARASLERAERAIAANASGEFVAVDLREALDELGTVIGLATPDDILNTIFSKFCIGK
ncbi:MAG TPA: tRNA uridine-5-carboxymethylaminomethyl(34) synthesis GTPase MnmE [Bacteroidota bacterium]|nr:tRNA uridine-5-carboxymethylaminomethyl(34) synthesis GTPase MnmE [Bacteroidota bacterium]